MKGDRGRSGQPSVHDQTSASHWSGILRLWPKTTGGDRGGGGERGGEDGGCDDGHQWPLTVEAGLKELVVGHSSGGGGALVSTGGNSSKAKAAHIY